jgi:uncharacterized membrane protein YebE (DUF533 family)
MFDARSILEGLVRGAAPASPNAPQQDGGLGDLLGQILSQSGGGGGEAPRSNASGDGTGGGLGDLLGELQRQIGGGGAGGQDAGRAGEASSGGLLDILGQVLGQATEGVREGATRIGDATGASDALGRATGGQGIDDLANRLRDFIRDNPIAAGTAAAGLGGLVLGTKTGRSIAGSATRIGALALVGGLAYKALQNYQAGKPLISGATPVEAAPTGSGFEPATVSNDDAILFIRAMVAAAAADGRIDSKEQARIVSSLGQVGLDHEAEEFLAHELNNPATVDDLARAVTSPDQALQVYTAARIAIETDTATERAFLANLAQALRIDPKLAAHIDATATAAAG